MLKADNENLHFCLFSLKYYTIVIVELQACTRRARAEKIARKIWLSIHPRNIGGHMTIRSPVHPSTPQRNQCEKSQFLASVGACNLI